MESSMQKLATAQQMGEAAQRRDHTTGELRKKLNQIVHSQDKNPHAYGYNPYAGKPNQYDPEAQKALDEAGDKK